MTTKKKNSVFQTEQDRCAYKLTETVTACSTPEQTQASQTLNTEEKKWAPLTKKLFTIDTCYEREKSVLPKGVALDIPTIYSKAGFMLRNS